MKHIFWAGVCVIGLATTALPGKRGNLNPNACRLHVKYTTLGLFSGSAPYAHIGSLAGAAFFALLLASTRRECDSPRRRADEQHDGQKQPSISHLRRRYFPRAWRSSEI